MKSFTIGFAGDHAGFELKQQLIPYLMERGYSIKDFGCYNDESCDYPDYAHPLAQSVLSGESRFGVAICFTANGISMTVNKYAGIRAAICWNTDLAELARRHNDANICSLSAKYTDFETAKQILDTFLNTQFEGGRHLRRVEKINLNSNEKVYRE